MATLPKSRARPMNNDFLSAWALVPKPLSGNKKGYKKGFKDGFESRDKEVLELKSIAKELIELVEPILLGGYERQIRIEEIKNKL